VDGLEWLNGDSEWRDESLAGLALALLRYPFRRAETLGSLLDRPQDVLQHWDDLTRRRPVVAVAAADAHARLGLRGAGDPYDSAATLEVPAYEQIFRAFSIALPQIRLTGDAAADGRAVIDEIRRGHVYSAIDALARPAILSFSATSGRNTAQAGDTLMATGSATLRVETNAPRGGSLTLIKDGRPLISVSESRLEHVASPDAAVYRVEVQLPGAPGNPPAPWLVSNPIYVGPRTPETPARHAAARTFAARWADGPATDWKIEHSVRSAGAIDVAAAVGGTQLLFRYALGGSVTDSPYVALAMPTGDTLPLYDRLVFTARADHPLRLAVEARAPSGPAGERWHRSVYLDDMPREVTVFFDDMRPRGTTSSARPVLPSVDTVLFVLDTVNTKLGTNGRIWLDDVRYAR
jgi:hypothetical protein